jgi:hypothetical protein
VKLNLGCGLASLPGWVNIDAVALPGVDAVWNLDGQGQWPWADGSVTEILASHVFEHVERPAWFMAQSWRVLANDGILDIRVPYYKHVFAFTDPTHKRFCTELTFDYWVPGGAVGLHEAYGAGFGSVEGGPRFTYDGISLVGEQQEELRVVLRKLP